MSKEEITSMTFDDANTLHTFYAIYQITKYNFIFKNPDNSVAYTEAVPAGTKIVDPMKT